MIIILKKQEMTGSGAVKLSDKNIDGPDISALH